MSSVGAFNVDLLTDIPLPPQDGGRGQQGATASLGDANAEARNLSGRSAHSSEAKGTVDLLGDPVQPQVSPVKEVAPVGGPIDLLGDEIVEHASAHDSPGESPLDPGIVAPSGSEGTVCMGPEPAGRAAQDTGTTHPSGIPSRAAEEIAEGASTSPATASQPSPAVGKQQEVPVVSSGPPEAAGSPRASNGGSQEIPPVDESANSASVAGQQLLPQQRHEESIQDAQQLKLQPIQERLEAHHQQPRQCTGASEGDAEEVPASKPAHSGEQPTLVDGSTEFGVAPLSGEALVRPAAESSDGSAPVRPSGGGGGSQSLPSDDEPEPGSDQSEPLSGNDEAQTGPGSEGDERPIDSDREVVEEEDAFGDFADFTSASHFLPGGGSGAPAFGAPPPPPSASAAAAARAAGGVLSSTSSPSPHRHAHLGTIGRPVYGMLGGGGGPHHGAASVSAAASEHGSLAGEFSDFSHHSPPPSIAPSRGGGGRKSVASIASVGSRAGGDDDLGDYGSVVGSSVWRAPSQMATSSYAAAAGADDDFGDFTSDITSTSDFAPSTQPPSAVAVSGPGSVHPDDDFGSFASHRSTADDDEDDFGNFNAAPAPAAAGTGASGGSAGAGPSGSGAPTSAPAAGGSGGAAPSGSSGASAGAGVGMAPGGGAVPVSPRDAAAPTGVAASHPYHSTQSVGAVVGGSVTEGAAVEAGLLQLPSAELRQAVVRALQPLLPAGVPTAGPPQLPDEQVVSAAWAQLRRHMAEASTGGAGGGVLQTGVPLPALPGAQAAEGSGAPDGGAMSRGGYTAVVKLTRPLRWKGSDSERRLLAGLGLGELAAQARMAEAAEGPRPVGSRGRMDSASAGSGSVRQMGPLASFGDTPCRMRAEMNSIPGHYRDTEGDNGAAGSNSRSRGLDQSGPESYGPLGADQGAGAGSGGTPRAAASANGVASGSGQGK